MTEEDRGDILHITAGAAGLARFCSKSTMASAAAAAAATSKTIELFTDAPLGVERIIESLQMLARLSREAAAAEAAQVSAAPGMP
jgi:hypothetical protein